MVKNNYDIRKIIIKRTVQCLCTLGKDWYTAKIAIEFMPGENIPDYCELDKWIAENINGHEMIIEEAVHKIHEYITKTYDPVLLTVEADVEDAIHSAVKVIK